MRSLQILLIILLIGLTAVASSFVAESSAASGAGSAPSSLQNIEQNPQESQSGFTVNNVWVLAERAGPLRWPIFVVFVIGVFLVCFKLFELLADKHESKRLENVSYRSMNLQQIIRVISSQRESMISRLHATMLNSYQAQQAHAVLHDEIANYLRFQQDRFVTFRQRVDFLADTASALGLLGTVWGIFTVFSQEIMDDEMVLTGMGVALITTLLGLVVSIVLNLSSTEVFSFFNRRLDRIALKSDELRFRLMELAPVPEETMSEASSASYSYSPPAAAEVNSKPPARQIERKQASNRSQEVTNPSLEAVRRPEELVAEAPVRPLAKVTGIGDITQESKPIARIEAVLQDRISNSTYGDSTSTAVRKPLIDSHIDKPVEPHELRLMNAVREDLAGKRLKNLCLVLLGSDGTPLANRQVEIKVIEGEGLLNDSQQRILLPTNETGEVRFDWKLSTRSGRQVITATVPECDAPGTSIVYAINARPGVPRKLKQFGNNQGGPAGEPLAKPLKVQVLDEFENPISDWPVMFSIELGGGVFENGKTDVKVRTNAGGEGIAVLRVGKDPGFNTVKVAVDGVVKELKFQAMSMS